ncbi:MAG: thiamine-phosphate kinase [Gemmatimonadetes bacterium]|nr:thiamine-phosphate kinase [Gemmatimonadota bacterium]
MANQKEGAGLPGEFELIRRIRAALPEPDPSVVTGIGDDAAAVETGPGMTTLLTTDTFVEGIDFDVAFSSWRQIGWKSLAANYSDIAAMGGVPRHALTTLCLPARRTAKDVEALYAGFRDLARHTGVSVSIVGGDLSSTDGPTVVSITVTGEAEGRHITTRGCARVGDTLCVTGHLGASEAGLRLLRSAREEPVAGRPPDRFEDALFRHRTPVPRVREGGILARSGWVHAMIDVSDGLSSDALHLCRGSGVGLTLDGTALPIADETRRAMEDLRLDPVRTALESGEEFELLCAVAPDRVDHLAAELAERTGTPLTPIGECVSEDRGCVFADHAGRRPLRPDGYDHFRS